MSRQINRPTWYLNNYRKVDKLWLDKNENSDEILIKKISSFLKKIDSKDIYSYPNLGILYSTLAKILKVEMKKLLLTAGSDAGIKMVFETFLKKNDLILRVNPTFAMYSIYSKFYKTKELLIDYKNINNKLVLDIDEILYLIENKSPKLICIPNPNSPTGNLIELKDCIKILKVAKKNNSLVLFDEAYYPFSNFTLLNLIDKFDNLLIVRSTAKSFGMAGFRVGYLISNPSNIYQLQKIKPMYEINNLGANVFNSLLKNYNFVLKRIETLKKSKKYFEDEIQKMGFLTYDTHGNFSNIYFGDKTFLIHKNLKKIIYFKKNFEHHSMKGITRISTTNKKNFIKILNHIRMFKNEKN